MDYFNSIDMLYNSEIQYSISPITATGITEGFLPAVGIVVAADGFRHVYDDAAFVDGNRSTCDIVTSSTSPLDFVLQADPEPFESTLINLTVVLRHGDCSDNNQVMIVRVCLERNCMYSPTRIEYQTRRWC